MEPNELADLVRDYGRGIARNMGRTNGLDYSEDAGAAGALHAALASALGFLTDDQRRMVAQYAVRPEHVEFAAVQARRAA